MSELSRRIVQKRSGLTSGPSIPPIDDYPDDIPIPLPLNALEHRRHLGASYPMGNAVFPLEHSHRHVLDHSAAAGLPAVVAGKEHL